MTDTQLLLHLAALMGWKVYTEQDGQYDRWQRHLVKEGGGGSCFIDLDGRAWIYDNPAPYLNAHERLWNPLHDMNDAMQIVEHLMEKYDCAFILGWDYNHSGKWHAGFGIASDEFPDAVADTRQRAIALAALETGEEKAWSTRS